MYYFSFWREIFCIILNSAFYRLIYLPLQVHSFQESTIFHIPVQSLTPCCCLLLLYCNHNIAATTTNVRVNIVLFLLFFGLQFDKFQFSPVENLLNPITSTPYNIKEKEIPTNRKIDLYSVQGTTLGLVLPIAIAGLWIIYMQRSVWKATRERISR